MNPEGPESVSAPGGGAKAPGGIDFRVFVWFRTRLHFQPLESVLKILSISGNWGLFWIGLAIVFWAAHGSRHDFFMALFMPVLVYGTLLVNYIIKSILRRERPALTDARLAPLVGTPSSKSFPSSHAAMSFAAASFFTYFYPQWWPVFFGLALLMSWTRVYVGVHFPSDVLAGTVVGLVMGGFWMLFLNWA